MASVVRSIALLLIASAAITLAGSPSRWAAAADRPNVLFVVADDLRNELGCYGQPAISPHVDALAARGMLFERAYCQQALCNPSRSSMLTGLRPDTLKLWGNEPHFRDTRPNVVTLPGWFKQHGYITRDVGKIFHNWLTTPKGDPSSWSAPEFLYFASHRDDQPQVDRPWPADRAHAPRCERRDVPDEAYYDGRVAREAVRVLGELAGQPEPFFLAVGFWKPHAPFNAPDRYWKQHRLANIPSVDLSRPQGAPEIAFHDGMEIRGMGANAHNFTAAEVAEIRHGYYANTTYMDAQLGKVLAALENKGLADKTIVVFCGDHGFHLGEHGLWAKTSCFELDARVPLIIALPSGKHAATRTAALAELLDLYPTLAQLCGIPVPSESVEGVSLVPVLEDPQATVQSAAFTQHPRPAYYERRQDKQPQVMGYSVRTDKVRYTEWRNWKTGKITARELYDHRSDPAEMENRIKTPGDKDALAEAVQLLRRQFPL